MMRSQAAFGALTSNLTHRPDIVERAGEDEHMEGNTQEKSFEIHQDSSYADSFFNDPNYIPYNYLPESYSQANLTQASDTFVNARSIFHNVNNAGDSSNNSLPYSGENSSMSPQVTSSQNQIDLDDLDDLILDDADVEAELNEPVEPVNRPFTPVHEIRMDDVWAQQPLPSMEHYSQQAGYDANNGFAIQQDPYQGTFQDYEEPVHGFYDVLDTVSEFDPVRDMMY